MDGNLTDSKGITGGPLPSMIDLPSGEVIQAGRLGPLWGLWVSDVQYLCCILCLQPGVY